MALLLAFVFLGLFCNGCSGQCDSGYSANDYAFHFPNKGTTDYAMIREMPSMTQFTVCFWMKSNAVKGTPFSYAISNTYDNELLLVYSTDFFLTIHNNERRMPGITAYDGKWHHICASWDTSAGSWQFYKDGTLAASGAGLSEGYTIMGGGLLVIGQEQDALGGGFDATQSFQGHLTGVNVWSSVIPSETIKEMSKSCLRGKGKVYKWSDFRYTVRGSPEVVIPSPCVPLQE